MMTSPVMAEDFKIGICNYVDDASLNQIVDNIHNRLVEIGEEIMGEEGLTVTLYQKGQPK